MPPRGPEFGSRPDAIRSHVERVLTGFAIATPALWAVGLLMPAGLAILCWLGWRTRDPRRGGALSVLPWFAVAGAQALSVLVNGLQQGRTATFVLGRMASTTVTGWIILGLALAVGERSRLELRDVTRAFAVVGGYIMVGAVVVVVLWGALGEATLETPTPIGLLLPISAAARESFFTMRWYIVGSIAGARLPRLILFFPWSTILGFAGITILLIARHEPVAWLRRLGCLGGVVGVLGSQGRAPFIALTIVLLLSSPVRVLSKRSWLFAGAVGSAAAALVIPFWVQLRDLVILAYGAVAQLRPGSSSARALAYKASLEGFRQAPVLGHGWVGKDLASTIPIPIGSSSSVYGLLYTGGAVTLTLFVVAAAITGVRLLMRAERSRISHVGFLVFLALFIFSYSEALYSFAIPNLLALVVVGAGLAQPPVSAGHRTHITPARHGVAVSATGFEQGTASSRGS